MRGVRRVFGSAVMAVILLGLLLYRRSAKIHWAREQAIPEIIELIQKSNYAARA